MEDKREQEYEVYLEYMIAWEARGVALEAWEAAWDALDAAWEAWRGFE